MAGTRGGGDQRDNAEAVFAVVPEGLEIILSYTSMLDVTGASDVLSAVFFDIPGGPVLTPISALIAPGSVIDLEPGGDPLNENVGGEWAYSTAGPRNQGISAVGLGIFGKANFPGENLEGPRSGAVARVSA